MVTLFNFVTIRNPRTPTEKELVTGFFKPPDGGTALLNEVAEARAKGGGAARRRLLRARGTEVAYGSVEAFAEREHTAGRAAAWMLENGPNLTVGSLEELRSRHEPLDGETLGRIWDNLAILTYVGGPPDLREQLVAALRAHHVLTAEKPATDEEARRLAEATPLFTAAVHGTTSFVKTPVDNPVDEPGTGRSDAHAERAAKLAATHARLAAIIERAKETARAAAVQPPFVPFYESVDDASQRPVASEPTKPGKKAAARPGPDAAKPVEPTRLVLDEDAMSRLDEASREVLTELDVRVGDSVSLAVNRIVAESARVGAEQAALAPPQRVARVGGSVWVANVARQSAATERWRVADDRTADQYGTFWGAELEPVERFRCRVRPLGIGDFRRVEQEPCCWVPGEVAHIENVLKGETKERTTESRTTTEVFSSLTLEEETNKEKDTQTTDRFEMEKEVAKTLEQSLKFDIGVNVSASYGPVKIVADTKFATSVSTKEADKQATKFAKEVTDKTVEKVISRTKEERSTRTTTEFSERNLHKLEAVDDHVVGLYRWVDKIYKAKVVNYGKRLMFEFLVPEPAAFHLYAQTDPGSDASGGLVKPIDPRSDEAASAYGRPKLADFSVVSETNYAFWAATYGALVEPPPAITVTTSKAYSRADMDQTVQFADSKTDLAMPAGYDASTFFCSYALHSENQSGGNNWITTMIGRQSKFTTTGGSFSGFLDGEDDLVPVNTVGRTRFYALNVEVNCTRRPEAYRAWQQKTFRAIIDGYTSQLAAYETALAQLKAQAGVEIQGNNPAFNRQTEAEELQKGCLRLLTSCVDLPSDAMKDGGEYGYPEFDCCEAIRDGSIVQFFQQLFEWPLITYSFYPYFWGRKAKWVELYHLDDVDPIFRSFLRSGFARVVVPVRPGYEKAALRFLADGSIWDGGATPGVDDPMYVAVENDLKEPVGVVDPEIEPWEIKLPTTLTVLQCESGCVPGTGLPCPCQDEETDHDHDEDDTEDDDG